MTVQFVYPWQYSSSIRDSTVRLSVTVQFVYPWQYSSSICDSTVRLSVTVQFVYPWQYSSSCNKNQQNAHFLHYCFNLIIVSSTCFEHRSFHPQENLYMQFYGISVMHPYKQNGGWQDVLPHPVNHQTAYMEAWKKYHKTACTNFPEDENFDVRKMSKTL